MVVVVLTLAHGHNAVRGHRTGSNIYKCGNRDLPYRLSAGRKKDVGPTTDVAADLCRSDNRQAVTRGSPCVRRLRWLIVGHHTLGRGNVTPRQQVRSGV